MTLSYESAKQLRDAGFPQRGGGRKYAIGPNDGWAISHDMLVEGEACYIPTLSELIEACGDAFGELENTFDGWRAYPSIEAHPLKYAPYWAKTPEEAVAKLYLAIKNNE